MAGMVAQRRRTKQGAKLMPLLLPAIAMLMLLLLLLLTGMMEHHEPSHRHLLAAMAEGAEAEEGSSSGSQTRSDTAGSGGSGDTGQERSEGEGEVAGGGGEGKRDTSKWETTDAVDYETCLAKVKEFSQQQIAAANEHAESMGDTADEQQRLRHLLFFLHIPRTGGRTYHQCFLKPLYPIASRCPRSYDTLRVDMKAPNCRLLATHNDFSLASRLFLPNTSVVTNMRDPVDRLLSAYEFTIETSARSLRWVPSVTPGESLLSARRKARKRLSSNQRTETRRVWPWSELIPVMEDDLWIRRNYTLFNPLASYNTSPSSSDPPLEDNYDAPHLVMPLKDFLNNPAVHDLLHNGATFQIAGITQNSILPEATFLRHCVRAFPAQGAYILDLAKARLSSMLHVGLTELHKESALLFAATIGRSLRDAAFPSPGFGQLGFRHQGMNGSLAQQLMASTTEQARPGKSEMNLLFTYKKCVETQKSRYTQRRQHALRPLQPLTFSKEARGRLSLEILDDIRNKNPLDLELLDYARQVFKRQQQAYAEQIAKLMDEEKELERERVMIKGPSGSRKRLLQHRHWHHRRI